MRVVLPPLNVCHARFCRRRARTNPARAFSSGLAPVVTDAKIPHIGYVGEPGQTVVRPRLGEVTSAGGDCENFSEGLACFVSDEKFGYIEKAGSVVIRPRYDVAAPFNGGLAAVAIGKHSTDNPESHVGSRGDRRGYVDETGKYVWQPSK